MSEKHLGKIESAYFGMGGYQDCQLGVWFSLTTTAGMVCDGRGFWTGKPMSGSKWNEADQIRNYGEVVKWLAEIMKKAKVSKVEELVGIPIEEEVEGCKMVSWRILEEVL